MVCKNVFKFRSQDYEITIQIADIGTAAMDSLISRINMYVDSIVNPESSQFKVVSPKKRCLIFIIAITMLNIWSKINFQRMNKLEW